MFRHNVGRLCTEENLPQAGSAVLRGSVINSGFKNSTAQRWFGVANCAPASWTAAALCRFSTARMATQSGSGLPQSKTSRNDPAGLSDTATVFNQLPQPKVACSPRIDKNGAVENLVTHNPRDFSRGELKFAWPRVVTPVQPLKIVK
jgi:hypothetical protein